MRYLLPLVLLLLATAVAQDADSSQTLRDLPQGDQAAIQHALQKSAPHVKADYLDTKIRAVDLNEDDVPEFLVQSTDSTSCGASGNCAFWILQKKGATYKILLKSIAQSYRVRTIKTGGFADIELGRHDSDYRTEWRGYKFDGTRYIKVKCWANVTGDEENDKPYPKPKIEPCKK